MCVPLFVLPLNKKKKGFSVNGILQDHCIVLPFVFKYFYFLLRIYFLFFFFRWQIDRKYFFVGILVCGFAVR